MWRSMPVDGLLRVRHELKRSLRSERIVDRIASMVGSPFARASMSNRSLETHPGRSRRSPLAARTGPKKERETTTRYDGAHALAFRNGISGGHRAQKPL